MNSATRYIVDLNKLKLKMNVLQDKNRYVRGTKKGEKPPVKYIVEKFKFTTLEVLQRVMSHGQCGPKTATALKQQFGDDIIIGLTDKPIKTPYKLSDDTIDQNLYDHLYKNESIYVDTVNQKYINRAGIVINIDRDKVTIKFIDSSLKNLVLPAAPWRLYTGGGCVNEKHHISIEIPQDTYRRGRDLKDWILTK